MCLTNGWNTEPRERGRGAGERELGDAKSNYEMHCLVWKLLISLATPAGL